MISYTCLSVQQPWAWLIVAGHKTIENRTWYTRYRGRIAIHASAKFAWDFWDNEDDESDPLREYNDLVREYFGVRRGTRRITRHADELRAIVGTVELVDCINTDLHPQAAVNPWSFDVGFAWTLANAEQWPNPITNVPGKLNLWKYNSHQPSPQPELFS